MFVGWVICLRASWAGVGFGLLVAGVLGVSGFGVLLILVSGCGFMLVLPGLPCCFLALVCGGWVGVGSLGFCFWCFSYRFVDSSFLDR